MTEHRPPVVSLIDYGRRMEIPVGPSGSNGFIGPRAEFDSRTAPRPEWKDEVERRVKARIESYKKRRADRAWRSAHGLGLEPGARMERGRPPRPLTTGSSESPAASRFLSVGLACLVLSVLTGGPLLDMGWTRTGGCVLSLGITAFFTAALWAACGMGDGLDGDGRTD